MDMFNKNGGNFEIITDGRTAFSTEANLLMLLTSEQTFNATLSFPDVTKTEIYGFSWTSAYNPLEEDPDQAYAWGATGQSLVGALPQEWSDTVVLGAVPSGANIHMGRAAFSRTTSPSHNWWSYPLSMLVPSGVEMQIAGSFLLEQAPGFCRAASIYISDDNLIAYLQQSVGAGAGNYDTWGNSTPPALSSGAGGGNTSSGGASIPVYANDSSPYKKVGSGTGHNGFGPGSIGTQIAAYNNGNSQEAVYSDPTNYASTYALTVKTRFGRLNS